MIQTTSLLFSAAPVQGVFARLTQVLGSPAHLGEGTIQAIERLTGAGYLQNTTDWHEARRLLLEGRRDEAQACLRLFVGQLADQKSQELYQAVTATIGIKLAHQVFAGYRALPRPALEDYARLPIVIEKVEQAGGGPPSVQPLRPGNYLISARTPPVTTFVYEGPRDEKESSIQAVNRIWFEKGQYWLNGLPLSHKQEAVINGDRYRIRLPEGFVLESHAVEIADQPDGQTLAAFLRVLGLTTLSGEVEKLFRSSLRLDVTLLRIQHEIPHPGGLQERMRDLAILAVFSALKARYLPGVKDCDALAFFHHLAAAVDQTNSTDEVLKVLTRSPAPWILQILSSIRDHARGLLPLSAVPEAFGLCEKIGDLEAPRRRPASPAQGEPSVLALLRLKPQEFAERPWRKYRVSERLRSELEAFRSFTAQKLDLEGLESRISEEGEDEDEEMKEDLKPGQTVAGMYRRYVARQRDSSGTGSRINGWTDRLMKDLKAAGVEGIANGYWIYGGDRPDDRFHGRIYISLRRREAVAIWKYLEQTFAADLKQRGVSIQFKMAVQREGLLRSDSGVVYFFAKDQREIYDAIVRMHGEHPEFFKGGRPIFTAPLVDASGREMNGISFGEHPYSRGESFGGLRAFALGQGIQLARLLLSTGLALDWEGLLQIFAFCLDRCGVDQEQPAFNQGGERNFLFLKGKMKA